MHLRSVRLLAWGTITAAVAGTLILAAASDARLVQMPSQPRTLAAERMQAAPLNLPAEPPGAGLERPASAPPP